MRMVHIQGFHFIIIIENDLNLVVMVNLQPIPIQVLKELVLKKTILIIHYKILDYSNIEKIQFVSILPFLIIIKSLYFLYWILMVELFLKVH